MNQRIVDAYKSQKKLQFGQSFEVIQIQQMLEKEHPILFDVGANCGQTTIEFIQHMPNADIYCFEPDPRAIRKFKILVNSPKVELIEVAVGAENGTILFHQSSGAEHIDPQGWDHSGSIRKPKSHLEIWPWVRFEKDILVPMIRLDDWTDQRAIGPIDFIWADVQGAESDLVMGALKTLERTRFFYTEFSDQEWYEGQINFDTLCSLLPNFSILHKFENDALFVANQELIRTFSPN